MNPLDYESVKAALRDGTLGKLMDTEASTCAVYGPDRPAAAAIAIRLLDAVEAFYKDHQMWFWEDKASEAVRRWRLDARDYRQLYREYGDLASANHFASPCRNIINEGA